MTAYAELLLAPMRTGTTNTLVDQVWRELGVAGARTVLDGALVQDVPAEVRLRVLRAVAAIDRSAVTDRADCGDAVASQVLLETQFLAGEIGVEALIPATGLPLSPKVVERALRGAATARLPRRVLRHIGIRTLDYGDACRLARRVAELPIDVHDELGLPRLRVALLGSVTTDYLGPILEASLFEHGIWANVRTGSFGELEQAVLNDRSWLREFSPDIVIVYDSALAFEPLGGKWRELAQRRSALCQAITSRFSSETIVTTLETLPSHAAPQGAPECLPAYNALLQESLPAGAYVFDVASLASELGTASWFDLRLWTLAGQPVALSAVPVLADRLGAFIRALVDPPIRLVVTDLDDTLWGGKVGEVGCDALALGDHANGIAFIRFQEVLVDWHACGAMLAAVSKNNLDEARAPFFERREMRLGIDHFIDFRASFTGKPVVVKEIADNLGLDLGNVLFLDNDPHERAEMREYCPEVVVPEWPIEGVVGLPTILAKGGWMLRPKTTDADRARHEMYRQEVKRRETAMMYSDLEGFLASLQLRACFERIDATTISRVTQLIVKTNQFNLTTRRRSRSELEEMMAIPDSYACVVDVRDRLGPYGHTGVMVALPSGDDSLVIDLWLLSCRVMGKTVELAMFEHLVQFARANDFRTIIGSYRRTTRNGSVSDFLPSLGFRHVGDSEAERLYEFVVADAPSRVNRFVLIGDQMSVAGRAS